jgi:hypothetical protein
MRRWVFGTAVSAAVGVALITACGAPSAGASGSAEDQSVDTSGSGSTGGNGAEGAPGEAPADPTDVAGHDPGALGATNGVSPDQSATCPSSSIAFTGETGDTRPRSVITLWSVSGEPCPHNVQKFLEDTYVCVDSEGVLCPDGKATVSLSKKACCVALTCVDDRGKGCHVI